MTVTALNKELGTATAALAEILGEEANWLTDLEIDTGLGRIEQIQARLDAVRLRLVHQPKRGVCMPRTVTAPSQAGNRLAIAQNRQPTALLR